MKRPFSPLISISLLLVTGAVIPASWDPPLENLPRPEVRVIPAGPWIALTFDDGPHAGKTEELLTLLKDEGVPATFFVVGKMVDRYPQLTQEIVRQGHELANHTYTHPRLTGIDDRLILEELGQTRKSIQAITGKETPFYRPPGGIYNRRTLLCASQAGYRMVLWSVLTRDVAGVSQETIYKRIVTGATDGGVVLMHSGVPATVKALPGAIRELRRQGYQFVTVSEMMNRSFSYNVSLPTARPHVPSVVDSESSSSGLALLR